MTELKLSIGSATYSLLQGDLSSYARLDRGLFQVFTDALPLAQNQPIRSFANEVMQARVGVAAPLSWGLNFGGGGSLAFHVTPDAQGSVTIRKSGELFRFVAGEDEGSAATVVRVPDGKAFVSLALNVGYEAGAAGEFTHGGFGVAASVDKEQRFRVVTHCCVDDTTPAGEAVAEAFRRFRLPFHPQSAPEPGDYCEWEFFGRLALSAGAAAGFRGFLFGGRSRTEVEKTFQSPAGAAAGLANPGLAAGIGLDVNWDQEDAFRIVTGTGADGKLSLRLFRMDRTSLRATLTASARVFVTSPYTLQEKVDALLQQVSERAFAGLPDAARRNALVKTLQQRLSSSPELLRRYISDISAESNQFLTQLGGVKTAGVTAAFERIRTDTSLLHYEFDLPVAEDGFALAMAGNFREAMTRPGVTLGPGSFVRNELVRRSTLSFELFGAFRAQTVEEFFQKSELEYVGGGVFQLHFTTGKKASRDLFGKQQAVEIYFVASADVNQAGAVSRHEVALNFTLSEANHERGARQLAGVLGYLAPSSGAADALRRAAEANPKLAARIRCRIASSAYRRLGYTAFRSPGKPYPLPHSEDASNYAAFVEAADQLFDHGGFQGQGFPNAVDRFADWAHYNVTVNDREGAASPPNRRNRGNGAIWPKASEVRASAITVQAHREMVRTYLLAAQAFLNLCEDLAVLGQRLDDVGSEEEMQELNQWLSELIKQDSNGFPLHFTHPTLMALARQMRAQVGPPRISSTGGEFDVWLELT